jgi:hypothetical protein
LRDQHHDGHPLPIPVDAQTAIEQCKAGNADAIPLLEQKLGAAKADRPKRS